MCVCMCVCVSLCVCGNMYLHMVLHTHTDTAHIWEETYLSLICIASCISTMGSPDHSPRSEEPSKKSSGLLPEQRDLADPSAETEVPASPLLLLALLLFFLLLPLLVHADAVRLLLSVLLPVAAAKVAPRTLADALGVLGPDFCASFAAAALVVVSPPLHHDVLLPIPAKAAARATGTTRSSY